MSRLDWDTLPRMLQELCDGHPGYSVEVYALDLPNGVRSWLCKGCYVRAWQAAGCPDQAGPVEPEGSAAK